MSTKIIKRGLLWGLLIYSVGSLFFMPIGPILDRFKAVVPWIGTGVIATEALFIIGLLVMATSLGLRIHNPFQLRKQMKSILQEAVASRMFWNGFWINAVGACGSSLLLCIGIFSALPVTSWGLVYLPIADLATTIAIRYWALRANANARERGQL